MSVKEIIRASVVILVTEASYTLDYLLPMSLQCLLDSAAGAV